MKVVLKRLFFLQIGDGIAANKEKYLNEGGHFDNILQMGIEFNQNDDDAGNITHDGVSYKVQGISLYGDTQYDFAIGSAVGIFDANNELVGVFDKYNFNPSERGSDAELATRLVHALSPFGVSGYDIYGGNLPSQVYEKAKEWQTKQ